MFLQIQESATHKQCEHEALDSVGMPRTHAFGMYLQVPYYMRVYYCFYSSSTWLQIQELDTYKVCANVTLYYVDMSMTHGLGMYLKTEYYMRV